jgi:hypothetical protein
LLGMERLEHLTLGWRLRSATWALADRYRFSRLRAHARHLLPAVCASFSANASATGDGNRWRNARDARCQPGTPPYRCACVFYLIRCCAWADLANARLPRFLRLLTPRFRRRTRNGHFMPVRRVGFCAR